MPKAFFYDPPGLEKPVVQYVLWPRHTPEAVRLDHVGRRANASSSSFVYHRIRSLTQSVGALLWSMAQLRRAQLRMVVDVVGSC